MVDFRIPKDPSQRAKAIGNAIVDERLYVHPEPYHELLTPLRAEQPVCWVEPEGYDPFWMVTKHADIQQVELAKDLFINEPRSLLRKTVVNEQIKKVTGGRPFLLNNLTNMDGANHMAHRKLTQAWFMPARLKALDEDLHEYAKIYVARMVAMNGECDFIRDIASWYPLRTIMRILGVPASDEPKMLQLTQQIFGPDDPDIKTEKVDIIATVNSFFDYFRALVDIRRREPADDVATIIANATIGDSPIAENEALSYFIIIATAGHDTTSSTIAGGLLALLQHPGEMARLRADPSLLPGAIDEMLRWVTPVTHFFRTATQDTEVRGVPIKAGDSLMMCYPSANRDEDVFEDPFRFDISRKPGRHIAFGYGPHVCLGQHLAKMEIRIFFEALLQRIDEIELSGDPAWVHTNFVTGLKRFPIRYRPIADGDRQQAAA